MEQQYFYLDVVTWDQKHEKENDDLWPTADEHGSLITQAVDSVTAIQKFRSILDSRFGEHGSGGLWGSQEIRCRAISERIYLKEEERLKIVQQIEEQKQQLGRLKEEINQELQATLKDS